MRRILLALLAVAAVGVFTARASRFGMSAEDISSYTTKVSISVPSTSTTICPTPLPAIPRPIWIRSVGASNQLDLVAPASNDGVSQQQLDWTDAAASPPPVGPQATAGRFLVWRTLAPAPACGYRITGTTTVHLRSTVNWTLLVNYQLRAQAGLFACPTTVVATTNTSCTMLATAMVNLPNGTNEALPIGFGNLDVLVPAGQELRLKVIALRTSTGGITTYAGGPPFYRWGYINNVANRTRIEIS